MMRVGSVGLPLDKATKYFRIKISIPDIAKTVKAIKTLHLH
jgi:hypothetical protein